MPFRVHDLSAPLAADRNGIVAIGNFDGVHRGHAAVLDRALDVARADGRPALVLSFEPHPRTLFKPDAPVFRLTPEADKARVLGALGFDALAVLPFTRAVAATSAENFVRRYLVEGLGARAVVTGYDFHFGAQRSGTPERLRVLGAEHEFGVEIVDAFADEGGALSSSRIRRLLGEGDVTAAAEALGYRWNVSGTVERGQQLGRTLGYPTANIVPPPENRLAHGVYAVRVRRADGALHDGVASFGRRPTVKEGEPWLETYLFDFGGDLYGEPLHVALFERLRGEQRFDSVDDLVEQMHGDARDARAVLARAKPLSPLDATLNFAA